MDKNKICTRLKELRNKRSVRSIAKEMGISPSALCMYEAGLRVPRDDIKVRIAEFYGVSVGSIFFAQDGHGA